MLLLLAGLAGLQWLREIVPALLSGGTPKSISELDLPTNPVHVLDLSLLVPAVFVTALMLLRRRPLGFTLAPVLLVFLVLITLAVATMGAMLGAGYVRIAVFVAPTVIPSALLVRCLRGAGPGAAAAARVA